jgi:hypothetical protein
MPILFPLSKFTQQAIRKWFDLLLPGLLILLAIITHRAWFNPHATVFSGDWMIWSTHTVSTLYKDAAAWVAFNDLGSPNIGMSSLFFQAAWSLLVHLGLNAAQALQITILWPIAILSFLSPYFLCRRLVKARLASLAAAIFYGSSINLLARETAHLLVAIVVVLVPLVLLLVIRALEENRPIDWFMLAITYSIALAYEVRISLILLVVIIAYVLFLHFGQLRARWKEVGVTVLGIILLNMYWLLPTVFGGAASSIAKIANRGIFGDWLVNMQNAFVNFDWSWTGGPLNGNFIPQPIPTYLWIIPIIAFGVLLFPLAKQYAKITLFFLVLTIIALLITKQSAEPFSSLYTYLYNYLPGFRLFRESSKFQNVITLGYMGLIALTLVNLRNYNRKVYFIGVLIVLLVGLNNLAPLATLKIRTLFLNRNEPTDYVVLNQKLDNDSGYSRVLWVPRFPQWGEYSTTHPRLALADMVNSDWQTISSVDPGTLYSDANKMHSFLTSSNSKDVLSNASIRYVVLPMMDTKNDNNVFIDYLPREFFQTLLDNVPYLKLVDIDTTDVRVYENTAYKPHLALQADSGTMQVTPQTSAEYTLHFDHVKGNAALTFAERYDGNWRFFSGLAPNITSKPLLAGYTHAPTDDGLQQFSFNSTDLAAQLPAANVQHNSDGTLSYDITLLFSGERFLWLGIAVSLGALFLGLLGLLTWAGYKKASVKTSS